MTTTNPTEAPTGRRRGPSMADVAREAGVSGQTVSRVSNGRNNVDAETRERVLAAMRKLGYRPNSAARALRTGRFRSIGVIMFTLSTLRQHAHARRDRRAPPTDAGYSITLIPVPHPTQGEVSVAFERLSEQAVDGVIIIIEAHLLDESRRRAAARPPGRRRRLRARGTATQSSTPTRRRARRLATEHLLELGHRTVWHVAGPERSYSAERRRGVVGVDAARPRRATCRRVLVGDWSTESGYRAGLQLAARPRGHRGVRGERPDGARRAPRAARGAAAPFPARSASSASTTWPSRRASGRRSRPCTSTSTRSAGCRSRRSCTRSRPASATAPRSSPPSSSCATARRRRRPDADGAVRRPPGSAAPGHGRESPPGGA